MPLIAASNQNTGDLFGMARIELLSKIPDPIIQNATETRMVLAKYAPISSGSAIPVDVHLDPEGQKLRVSAPDGPAATYRVSEVLGKEIEVGPTTLRVENFWNDFEMRDGFPVNASAAMKNPAVLVRISERRQVAGGNPSAGLLMRIAPGRNRPGHKPSFLYEFSRNGKVVRTGEARQGDVIETGWNDWSIRVLAVKRLAVLAEEVRPAATEEEKSGVPGFLARLEVPGQPPAEAVWIESGKITTLVAGTHRLRVGYGLQVREIPFRIRLVDFQVPRFEGTTSPSNFIATVEFQDASGNKKIDTARMNKPANWPGGFWPLITGRNYKFSQAEWNPQDLGETTLQVLYDPGWLFKWIGSLAICTGIFMLFYFKPKSQSS
jgi:hypothetical protein